jgi:hypothetical protein
MLMDLHEDLAKRDVRLRIVEAHGKARDLLRAAGLEERIGHIGRRMTIEHAVAEPTAKATPSPSARPE